MVNTTVLSLEGRLSVRENPFPAFTFLVREFLLNTFSPRRHLYRKMQGHEQKHQYFEAAQDAHQLQDYEAEFAFYDRLAATGNRRGHISAAELAESLGDYERGLRYRLAAGDLEYAGDDALRLGRPKESLEYWRKLCWGDQYELKFAKG